MNVGDRIYFKKTVDSSWSPGQIFSKNNIPICYIVTDNSNCKFVRNRKIIRPDLSHKENREVPEFLRYSPSISPKSNIDLSRSNANVMLSVKSCSSKSSPKSNRESPMSKSLLDQSQCFNSKVLSEDKVMKKFDGYMSSRGRVVRNPRSLTFD